MIDHLTLNAALNVAWYATNVLFQFGQENFHALFTLFAPYGISSYRYFSQTIPQYHFSLGQWVLYTIAYCFLLLVTRDAVEFVTLGKPFLDNALTLFRITLAVFWFSILRHGVINSTRNIWRCTVWAFIWFFSMPLRTYPSIIRCGRWMAASLRRARIPFHNLVYTVLGQATYNFVMLTWYRMTNRLVLTRKDFVLSGLFLAVVTSVAICSWYQVDTRQWLTDSFTQGMGHGYRPATQIIAPINTLFTTISSYTESSMSWSRLPSIAQAGLLGSSLSVLEKRVASPTIAAVNSFLPVLASQIIKSVYIHDLLQFAQARCAFRAFFCAGNSRPSPYEFVVYAFAHAVLIREGLVPTVVPNLRDIIADFVSGSAVLSLSVGETYSLRGLPDRLIRSSILILLIVTSIVRVSLGLFDFQYPIARAILAFDIYLLAAGLVFIHRPQYNIPAIVFAKDCTKFLAVTPAHWIYRRSRALVNDRTNDRASHVLASLTLFSVMAGVGYVMYATLPSSLFHPHAILHLKHPLEHRSTAVQSMSQEVGMWARPSLAIYANTALAPFLQATKAYQMMASPTTMLMYLAPHENPVTLIWQALKACFQAAVDLMYPTVEKELETDVLFYADEKLMTEILKVGQVCYDEDGIELPCSNEPDASEKTSFLDVIQNGVREFVGYLKMF